MGAICPMCNGTGKIDWMNARQVAHFFGVDEGRVRQLIRAGRFPGAEKCRPNGGGPPFWKIPAAEVAAVYESRRNA